MSILEECGHSSLSLLGCRPPSDCQAQPAVSCACCPSGTLIGRGGVLRTLALSGPFPVVTVCCVKSHSFTDTFSGDHLPLVPAMSPTSAAIFPVGPHVLWLLSGSTWNVQPVLPKPWAGPCLSLLLTDRPALQTYQQTWAEHFLYAPSYLLLTRAL